MLGIRKGIRWKKGQLKSDEAAESDGHSEGHGGFKYSLSSEKLRRSSCELVRGLAESDVWLHA